MDVIEGVKEIPVWGARYSPPERNDGGPEVAVFVKPARSAAVLRVMLLGVRSRWSVAFDVAPSFLMVSSVFLELF